ncbi:TPA: hypothetical protein ACMDQQ_004542, partial [Vibrio parahaemolyticus]|nr:hypothetical protein [Vibrio parahaemolyticus]EGR0983170.1 hypothetical protein [Vibrio parahaemolyticus]EGR1326877.1 hypothetical protein [Vibrio parahaemolyticus]EGR1485557.1 hypothetical protein [Vibrio parahaemolyticus]EGR2005945.1 hypothetical protein [Vibrio parahaemolyticus]
IFYKEEKMKILLLLVPIVASFTCKSEVLWDIDFQDYSKNTGKIYVYDLVVGDKAKINSNWAFCITKEGKLAIDGTVEVGSGNTHLTILPGYKVAVETEDEKSFLKSLISTNTQGECSFMTAHQGKYIRLVDSVNGKTKISELTVGN